MFRETLEPLANSRNAAMTTQTRTLPNNLRRLRRARKEFKTAIFSAKEEWTTAFAKRCKCRLARYCADECQLEDWSAHKVECMKAREINRVRQELKLKQKEAEEKEAEGKIGEDENEEGRTASDRRGTNYGWQ